MKSLLLAMCVAASLVAVRAQEENKDYETKVFNDWLADSAQSNIKDCTDVHMSRSPQVYDNGRPSFMLQVDATVTVNDQQRHLTVQFSVYDNDEYRVQAGPFFREIRSPEQQAKEAEEGKKLEKANELAAKQSALRQQVESKAAAVFGERKETQHSDSKGWQRGMPTKLELSAKPVGRLETIDLRIVRTESNICIEQVALRLSPVQLDELHDRFNKYKEWAQAAETNNVKRFRKPMDSVGDSGADAKITFAVTDDGNPKLELSSSGGQRLTLGRTDIEAVSAFLSKLTADLATAHSGIEAEVNRLANESDKNAVLFK